MPVRVLLVSVVVLGAVACRPSGEATAAGQATPAGEGVRVTDDLGRAVVLAQPATRIASLSPSNTEILFALGCGQRVVLRDRVSSFPPAVRALPATSSFTLSAEHVAGFAPDLVLLSHVDAQRLRALQLAGLVAASFDPRTLEALYGNVRAIGTLCGAGDAAGRLAAELRRRVARVAAAVRGRPRPKVYIETDGSDPLKLWTAGPGSLVDELLRVAGGANLAAARRPYMQLGAEEVFSARPDLILMMSVEVDGSGQGLARLRARPGWAALEAVRRGQVIDTIHADLLSRPGPRLVAGLEALARALHPGAFSPGRSSAGSPLPSTPPVTHGARPGRTSPGSPLPSTPPSGTLERPFAPSSNTPSPSRASPPRALPPGASPPRGSPAHGAQP